MHKIFIDGGEYNIIFQISQIIYSSLISSCVTIILNYLALSDSYIINFKQSNIAKNKGNKIGKSIKIKICLFFIIGFILLCFYWYYISCFCAVYKNTQIIFIKNISISFGLSLMYPFGINIVPTILRIFALRSKKKDREFLYKISLVF